MWMCVQFSRHAVTQQMCKIDGTALKPLRDVLRLL